MIEPEKYKYQIPYWQPIKVDKDLQLKSFILYCQAVETMYKDWKDASLNYLMKD